MRCFTWCIAHHSKSTEKSSKQLKAEKAFYIFLLFNPDLDVPALARGFGLLHLPSMPELKGKTFADFISEDLDYSTIPYL